MRKLIFSDVVFAFCCIVLAYFLYYNKFGSNDFRSLLYYLCFKHKEFLLVLLVTVLLNGKRRLCWLTLSFFYFVRAVWQWWEMFRPIPANSLLIFNILFGALMICILFVIFIADSNKIYQYLKRKMKWLNLN